MAARGSLAKLIATSRRKGGSAVLGKMSAVMNAAVRILCVPSIVSARQVPADHAAPGRSLGLGTKASPDVAIATLIVQSHGAISRIVANTLRFRSAWLAVAAIYLVDAVWSQAIGLTLSSFAPFLMTMVILLGTTTIVRWRGDNPALAIATEVVALWLALANSTNDLRARQEFNRSICAVAWADRVVPFTVELGTCDVDGIHLVVGQSDTLRIGIGIQFAVDLQTGVSRGSADQIDNDAVADQRLSPPVLTDEREQAMLDPRIKMLWGWTVAAASGINRSICAVTWVDRVVPFTVELGTGDVDGIHLVVGQSDTLRIGIGIQLAVDLQPGVGRGGADQINDDAVADQRLSPPVLTDEREQAMLDPRIKMLWGWTVAAACILSVVQTQSGTMR